MEAGDGDHPWGMAPGHITRMNKNIKLFDRTVAPNNALCDGIVPTNNILFDRAVLPNSTLFAITPDLDGQYPLSIIRSQQRDCPYIKSV